MKIIILYATTEGQTLKIARFAQDRLAERGAAVELMACGDSAGTDLARFDGAIVAASIHAGQYQTDCAEAAHRHRAALANMPNVFLSVSLSAAGDDPDDWAGLKHAVAILQEATDWTPREIWHVAGAFRFSHYNWFKTWAMRWIAAQKGVDPKSGEDVEFTDWDDLRARLDQWHDGLTG